MRYSRYYESAFRPYVPVRQRQAMAAKELEKQLKKGQKVSPVVIKGQKIASTFWGKAWCTHLESFGDYSNRLPRGRAYVRNGSVIDLQIEPGKILAKVSGSSLYTVTITITPLPAEKWQRIKSRCAGQIASVVELLQGKLSDNVIATVTGQTDGLFPLPKEIKMSCSCPDYAGMCKHIAAVAYGVGARLDDQPELLFTLRNVDQQQLIEEAVTRTTSQSATRKKTIAASNVADVFGIELTAPQDVVVAVAAPKKTAKPKATKPKASKTSKTKVSKGLQPKAARVAVTTKAAKDSATKPAKAATKRKTAKKPIAQPKIRKSR